MTGREHARGAIDLGIGVVEIGVVADLARRAIKAPHLLHGRHLRRHGPRDESLDRGMIAVDVFGGREIDRVSFTLQNSGLHHAGDAASRATGRSRIGRLTSAAKMPSATPSHQTTSYDPVRS